MTSPNPPSVDGYEQAAAAQAVGAAAGRLPRSGQPVLDGAGPLHELIDRVATPGRRGPAQHRPAVGGPVGRDLRRLGDPLPRRTARHEPRAGMDARGQRLDVANTIYYRRRKGTVGLLEQLAADVTGWECRVVEFFRALGPQPARPRPGDRPARGQPPIRRGAAPAARGRTHRAAHRHPAGGWADLRSRSVRRTRTAPRSTSTTTAPTCAAARGALGWYGIPKIGVFLWRDAGIARRPGHPGAGRRLPRTLRLRPDRPADRAVAGRRPAGRAGYGEGWRRSPQWQVPGPITRDSVRRDPRRRIRSRCRRAPTRTRPRRCGRRRCGHARSAPATRSTTAMSASGPRSAGSSVLGRRRPTSRSATTTGSCSPDRRRTRTTGASRRRRAAPTRPRSASRARRHRRSLCPTRSPPSAPPAR